MVSWYYKGKEIKSLEDVKEATGTKDIMSLYGFVYILTYDNGQKYIGKKNFYYVKELPTRMSKLPRVGHITFLKRIVKHKKVEYEKFKQETDWLTYNGSNGFNFKHEVVDKQIIEIVDNKRLLTYLEAKYIFIANGLEDPNYVNENILGRFFRGNLSSSPKEDYTEMY